MRPAGRAARRSRARPATIAAKTISPIAHTIGNATGLIRAASPISLPSLISRFPRLDCG